MSVDMSESCDAERLKSPRWLSAINGHISKIELRFPLASRGLLSIFDQAVFSATSFFTAVLIGRTTSPEELGLYYLTLSIILIITGVLEQLVAAPYAVYSKRRHGRELAEYAGSIFAHHLIGAALAVCGLLVAILCVSLAGRTTMLPGLWALVVFAPLLLLRNGIRRFTFASLNLKAAVVLDATVAVVQLSGLALLHYLGWLSLFGIFAAIGTACGVACAGWYLIYRTPIQFVRARFLPDYRRNWIFGKWALQTYLLGCTTPQIMLWLISVAVGPASTGKFGACNTLIGLCNVILFGIDNVLTPQAAHAFATGGVRDLRRILIIAGSFLIVTMGAFSLFVIATGDWLVVLAFGSTYEGTGPIFIALTLSTLLSAVCTIASNGLWAIDKPRSNFIADVCSMSVMLIVAAILVFPLGAFGAAIAVLAGTSVSAIVRSSTFVRCLENHVPDSNASIGSAVSP